MEEDFHNTKGTDRGVPVPPRVGTGQIIHHRCLTPSTLWVAEIIVPRLMVVPDRRVRQNRLLLAAKCFF